MSVPAPDGGSLHENGGRTTHPTVPLDKVSSVEMLASQLVEELAAAWRRGEPLPAEDLLDRHPDLYDHPQAALRVVYEEVCLRQEFGQEVPSEEILSRFPQWAGELRVLLECHRLLEPAAEPSFPQVGEPWGDFQLLAELGQGAQGRVFLATQPELADRPVVLKLTPCTGREHLSLARLQHTGIVPLYFVQDNPARNLRTLCMPYFGGVTLARLLEALRATPLTARTGEHMVRVLEKAQEAAPVALPSRGPARLALARVSYVQAVCWIGACLGDALQYAHERGLVHLDIKPSNVLLAAEGQPMLLDFHLAQAPLHPSNTRPEWIGGTRAYMPPEQQAALAAVNTGQPITAIVDGRADIYSLGVLLYEALGGSVPVQPGVSPPLCRCNPEVSVGLSDLVARCLADHARDRYPDAASLAADLRRHVSHLPLRGVRNRSWRERWNKWRRRAPHALNLAAVGLLALIATGAAVHYHLKQEREQSEAQEKTIRIARVELVRGQEWQNKNDHARAAETFQRGLNRVKDAPDAQELARELARRLLQAKRAQVAEDLHRHVETIRYLAGAEVLSPRLARPLVAHCRAIWTKRRQILERSRAELPEPVEARIRTDLLDLALIWSDVRVQLASGPEVAAEHRQALVVLDEAETLLGPGAILARARQDHAEKLGDRALAARAARAAGRLRPQTSWEYCLLGRSLIRSRNWAEAAVALQQAVDREPNSFWANYYQGVCAYEAKNYPEAVNSFRACITLNPQAPACFYNRALAYAALGQAEPALRDYQHALRTGFDPAAVHYQMALLHWRQRHDRAAALESLEKVFQADRSHREARALYKHLKG